MYGWYNPQFIPEDNSEDILTLQLKTSRLRRELLDLEQKVERLVEELTRKRIIT